MSLLIPHTINAISYLFLRGRIARAFCEEKDVSLAVNFKFVNIAEVFMLLPMGGFPDSCHVNPCFNLFNLINEKSIRFKHYYTDF
jgi:hypothetical protein